MKLPVYKVKKALYKGEKRLTEKSFRVRSVITELREEYIEKLETKKVDLFEILVRLILITDKGSCEVILDFLKNLDNETAFELEKWTLISSAHILNDHFIKDHILWGLKRKEDHSK